jgi:hypothetical protein
MIYVWQESFVPAVERGWKWLGTAWASFWGGLGAWLGATWASLGTWVLAKFSWRAFPGRRLMRIVRRDIWRALRTLGAAMGPAFWFACGVLAVALGITSAYVQLEAQAGRIEGKWWSA